MIPLRLGQGGSFFVGSKHGTKAFWVCSNSTCLARVMKKPEQVLRTKHNASPKPETVQQELSNYWTERARISLISAQKSGMIVHGSQRIRNCDEQNLIAIIFSNDVGSTTRAQISEIYNGLETLTFPGCSKKIGRLLRRGPRSVLALRPSRRTQSLIHTLRVGCSLG